MSTSDRPSTDTDAAAAGVPLTQVRDELVGRDAVRRLWERDHTLWSEDPTEISDRLGWLDLPSSARADLERLEEVAAGAQADGMTDAVVLGMGGSSLFPLVLAESFADHRLRLHVVDTVDPAAVRRLREQLPLDTTLFVSSSKSGGTVETRTLLEVFWDAAGDGRQHVAVTDPGSSLEALARERGFRAVVNAPADVGGRYSALTPFGLLPATLVGAPVTELLDEAAGMADSCGPDAAPEDNPGLELGAFMAAAVRAGRDKLTILLPDRFATFGAWVEQLVAESTGKGGTGVLPVVGEPVADPDVYGDDRAFVVYGAGPDAPDQLAAISAAGHPVLHLGFFTDPPCIGAEVLRWEVATALAGAAMQLNPFDQPDVEAAKVAAKSALSGGAPDISRVPVADLLAEVGERDYVAVLAYVDPGSDTVAALQQTCRALRDRLHRVVTFGLGPRYLHSTGQLHKGGANNGVFCVVVGDDPVDLDVPGADYTLSTLKRAQAAGDLAALSDAGRRAGMVDLQDLLSI